MFGLKVFTRWSGISTIVGGCMPVTDALFPMKNTLNAMRSQMKGWLLKYVWQFDHSVGKERKRRKWSFCSIGNSFHIMVQSDTVS
jgi:hypothetical protein